MKTVDIQVICHIVGGFNLKKKYLKFYKGSGGSFEGSSSDYS